MKRSILIAALCVATLLTGCMSTGITPQEQANFNAHMDAMTPGERIAFWNYLSQTSQRSYDVTVHNYNY